MNLLTQETCPPLKPYRTLVRVGDRYGNLLVTEYLGIKSYKGGYRKGVWLCLCDCGNTTVVPSGGLITGNTKSCGCRKRRNAQNRRSTHSPHLNIPDACFIPLTKDQWAIVDPKNFPRLSENIWHAKWNSSTRTYYAARTVHLPDGKVKTIFMHNEVMPPSEGKEIDHIRPQDTLDNRECNLREAYHQENNCNKRLRWNNRSGHKGVRLNSHGSWEVSITAKSIRHYIGSFKTFEEACAAYKSAAERLHGEFARMY